MGTPNSSRCQSFDEIQSRLDAIQGDLSRLTETIKRSNHTERVDPFPVDSPTLPVVPSFGHIVRDTEHQVERYHGPWSLSAQCRRFGDDLTAQLGIDDSGIKSLLQKMQFDCIESQDLSFYSDATHAAQSDIRISLPPKQLLSIVLESFLKDPDYTTDIFHHQLVYHAMDRVYKDPSSPNADSWALCFNLIVLLSLGKEHPLDCQDPFVRPMLQAVQSAVRNWRLLMEPRLINIQTLSLYVSLPVPCSSQEPVAKFFRPGCPC